VLAAFVDLGKQLGDCASLCPRYFLQLTPEGIFEADARRVGTNFHRMFYDCGFHWLALMQPISHGEGEQYSVGDALPIEETNSR